MYYNLYHAFIHYSTSENLYYGRVNNVKHTDISFSAATITELKTTFVKAIDAYIDNCARADQFPEVPFELN